MQEKTDNYHLNQIIGLGIVKKSELSIGNEVRVAAERSFKV